MKSYQKKNKKLGNSVKKLEIKIIKESKNRNIPMYHIVVSRKRCGNKSRLDKVGFFHFATRYYSKIRLMGLDLKKINRYVLLGATFHRSFIKLIV